MYSMWKTDVLLKERTQEQSGQWTFLNTPLSGLRIAVFIQLLTGG